MAESKDAALTLKIILRVSFKENSKICGNYDSHNVDTWTNLINQLCSKDDLQIYVYTNENPFCMWCQLMSRLLRMSIWPGIRSRRKLGVASFSSCSLSSFYDKHVLVIYLLIYVKFLLHLFSYLKQAYTTVCMWMSENNLGDIVFSFYHLDPKNKTLTLRPSH